MNPSKHGRHPMARLALAIGGIAALILAAAAAQAVSSLIGGPRGMLAGIVLTGAVFAGCGLAFRPRPRRAEPRRPAPVRLPVPARDACEPVKSLT